MQNYTITYLAKLFNTTRNTVYLKFKDKRIQEYLDVDDRGTKTLLPEGLTTFQMLMANSKAALSKQEVDGETDDEQNTSQSLNYQEECIRILNDQIAFLKQVNEQLITEKVELSRKYDSLFDVYMAITKPQPKLEEPKKGIIRELVDKIIK